MNILLVIRQRNFSKIVSKYLTSEGYHCESVFKISTTKKKIENKDFDCLLLDLQISNGSIQKLLKDLKTYNIYSQMIIISEIESSAERIQIDKYGVGDYVVKPFLLKDLSNRVFTVIKRKRFDEKKAIVLNDLNIDLEAKSVYVHNKLIDLTKMELNLLIFLAYNKNCLLSKSAIAEHLYASEKLQFDNFDFIYTHIKNIKNKISKAGGRENIQSVYRLGYRLVTEEL